MQGNLSGKAESSHSHSVSDLPVSSSLSTNSTNYVPTSAAVYSLKSTMDSISSEISRINDQLIPNSKYDGNSVIATWNSSSDADEFLSRYTHENYYNGLSLGNIIVINNIRWEIAGFDCEHNQTAADGTVYDNGYGIALILKERVETGPWHTYEGFPVSYSGSSIRNKVIPAIIGNFTSFGDHIVNRNVLLSSSVTTYGSNTTYYSNDYTWTTDKATLMSGYQLTGTAASYSTKYDDGEANYKLPLFDYENYWFGFDGPYSFWTRGIAGGISISGSSIPTYAYRITNNGFTATNVTSKSSANLRLMVYIR